MGEPVRKPSMRELIGTAVNASGLQFRAYETPIDRVAALGAATLGVRLGVDRDDLPIAAAKSLVYGAPIDERDALHGELGAELLHILEGDQLERLPRAIGLFAEWITRRRLFVEYAAAEHLQLRLSFAGRALHEWLSCHCIACGGTGREQKLRSGAIVRPQGLGQRNAVFQQCRTCVGTGRSPSSPPQRMKSLSLTREQYDAGRWDQRFSASRTWLNQLLPNRVARVLTAELERRKRHR
jgi:hypothetical protein